MLENPFLFDLKKSLELEMKNIHSFSKKIEISILNDDYENILIFSNNLSKSVERYKEIEELILKEMSC